MHKVERPGLPAVEEVPAAHLLGRTLNDRWSIVERVQRDPGASGGHFSVNYIVEGSDGTRAFMKALNVAAAFKDGDRPLIDRLKLFADAYVAERDLLQKCCDRKMSRVIRLLDHGEVEVPDAGVLREVPCLVLEMADGDIRAYQARLQDFDLAWVLRTMKDAAMGLEQLHYALAAHQDLKPSNVLTQGDGRVMKLGDVGLAEHRDNHGPHTSRPIPGAVGYAPPEQLYGAFSFTWEERRAGDIYQLGSLAGQLFLGHSMTALMHKSLPAQFRCGRWQGTFSDVLPYLRNAHADVLRELEEAAYARMQDPEMTAAFIRAVRELTEPDPAMRGHPLDRRSRTSSYAVRRYVSVFNRLAARARARLQAEV